ncbi:transcription factor/nuclear export subunit protein 2-domain-containing protein [Pyronema omphalodes]|nr:transcription factor/nuclear export subunit protein 2-domain-containing protein [Pyronema omphalodes]
MSSAGETGTQSTTPAPPPMLDIAESNENSPMQNPSTEQTKQFYFWEYLTDDVVKDWSNTGSATVKEQLTEVSTNPDLLSVEPELSIIFQELIKTALDARLHHSDIARFLTNYFETFPDQERVNELKRIFLQTVNLYESSESNAVAHPILVQLMAELKGKVFSNQLLGQFLEVATMAALGLVTSQYHKKAVRVTTALVYKQRKHNLLREETEGFSKLITEFFTSSYSGTPLEMVGTTGERVKGLIGAFELDPGRVLDILLDTAACTVVSNARFFVRLLKGSAWWPQQLQDLEEDKDQDRHNDQTGYPTEQVKEQGNHNADHEFFDKLRRQGVSGFFEKLKTSRGNKVAAQLLGFKFRYYQNPDVDEVTPENLLVLSALLIKIGFVDLADLYPHLAPHDDEGMDVLVKNWKQKMEEKSRGGKRNALMMAGALADDTLPPPPKSKPSSNPDDKKQQEEPKKEEPKPKKDDNQKLVLLKHLLAVGALSESLFILGQYPWLPGPSDDIAEHLARVISHSLDGVYRAHQAPKLSMGTKTITMPLVSRNGGVEQSEMPRRRPMVTFTVSNLKLKTGDVDYRFFWDDWKEGVPVCREPRHVVILMETLGRVLGVKMGRDASVITKVCRIGRDVLKSEDCTPEDRQSWIGVARSLLVPAVSLSDGNQGIVNEVWKLLECFSTEQRYSLYGEWISVTCKRNPELKNKVAETEKETKDLLKRISKTTIGPMARALAKVATSNPITVMQVVLSQVEGYDNLIECVVDAARYFTPLGFDAVGFCVLNSMSNESKSRVQADGMLTSKWLQSLSVFCGKIYTRYHKKMDPAPILEYVARQLKRNRSVELVVLQQLMQSMAGINPEANLNDTQLQGLAGGEMLRKQILKIFRDPKAEDNEMTTKKLTDTLAHENLAKELLILIAQERQTCIFRLDESGAPLKVLANLFDEIHVVLSQYLDLMKMGFTPERFEEVVPSVGDLCQKFGINPPVAWWIYRLGVRSRMKRLEVPTESDDVEMKDAATAEPTEASPAPEKKSPWHPVLEKMFEEVMPILPEPVWSKLSIGFYVTFWQLEIYDIVVPMEAYQAETNRINAAIRALDMDRSDVSIAGQAAKRRKREELMDTYSRLSAELKIHIRDHNFARRRLGTEKEHWFSDDRYNQRDITDTFIQHCLFERVMLSPNDASFCSRFIREVHKMGTPKFQTIGVYDSIFGRGLGTIIFICTQREAENYGRFLKEVLTDLHSWHSDRALYEREAHGVNKNLVGFNVKGVPFDWEDFRKILYKWHKTLHAAVKNCLSSKEYMHIRNAIVVLKHVVDFFPAVDWIGRTVVEKVEALVKVEKREDLKIAAMTLLGMLKRKEKDWMIVPAFQKSEAPAGMQKVGPGPTTTETADSATSPAQGQVQQGQRPLNPMTKEFRPSNTTSEPQNMNAQSQGKPSPTIPSLPSKPQGGDKEDGEVDDRRSRLPPGLPQRPPQLPPPQSNQDRRPAINQRDPPQMMQSQQQQQQNMHNNRVSTPRRDEQRQQPNDMRGGRDMNNRTPSGRGPVQPHPQHQLPERPDINRQTTLERRDSIRDTREPVRHDSRGRQDNRLPEKPPQRHESPNRRGESRDARDSRDSREMHTRHEHDRRGPPPSGRELDFQRGGPGMQQAWDDRNAMKDERMSDTDRRPPSASRNMPQMPEPERGRMGRDDRDGRRRSDRHDAMNQQQSGRLNDFPMDRPDVNDRRIPVQNEPIRKAEVPMVAPRHNNMDVPMRHHPAEEMMAGRAPPAGPRSNFDRRNQGPQKDLFSVPQGNQIRGPPSGPQHGHPSDQFRDNRHPGPGGYHPHQDPNHGRLNPPEPVIPKGPRNVPFGPRGGGPGGLNIRGASQAAAQAAQQHQQQHQQQQHHQQQQNQHQQHSQVMQQQQPQPIQTVNTGPGPRIIPTPSMERHIDMLPPNVDRGSHSAPQTPTVEITTGIHPDRLKAMSQGGPQQQQNIPVIQTSAPGNANFSMPHADAPSPVNAQSQLPPSGPRTDDLIINQPDSKAQQPPTGPARRDGDDARHQRRRILNVQSQLTGDEAGRELRGGRGGRRTTGTTTPTTQQPSQPLSRQPSDLDRRLQESRRGSVSGQEPQEHSSRGRHHRSDRDREHRDRGDRDRDRRAVEAERERERERERKGSSSGKERDRDREHRRDRDRESRRDSGKRPSDTEGKRDDVKRRRTTRGAEPGRGEQW